MEILRTPDERFSDLADWPFQPRYLEVEDLRIHYVDEGPEHAAPVLLLHGEPSWGYLYRHMISPLADRGHRVVVPDLVGFGRSDKPASMDDYSYASNVRWMQGVVESLDLRGITLFCQDWGGLVGLRVLTDAPERFDRVVVANTGLPTGDQKMPDAFFAWQKASQEMAEFPVAAIIDGGTAGQLPAGALAAYDAPFPDDSYKAGARIFPALVPTSPDDPASDANRRAWTVLEAWDKPLLTAFSDGDPITRGGERVFQQRVPGAAGRAHPTVRDAGHFLQEDAGPQLASIVADFIAETS